MPNVTLDQMIDEEIDFVASCANENIIIDQLNIVAEDKKAELDKLTSVPERDIEAIKVASKESKDARKSADIAIENLEKKVEKFRRGQLTKIGCNPDNHPTTHTAVKHLAIRNVEIAEHQHRLKDM